MNEKQIRIALYGMAACVSVMIVIFAIDMHIAKVLIERAKDLEAKLGVVESVANGLAVISGGPVGTVGTVDGISGVDPGVSEATNPSSIFAAPFDTWDPKTQ